MKTSTDLSLTAKFNALTISLILASSLGIGAFAIQRDRVGNYEKLLRHGTTTAAMVARNSEYGVFTEDRDDLREIIDSLRADVDISYVAILNANLRVLVSKATSPGLRLPLPRSPAPDSLRHEDFISSHDQKAHISILMPVVSLSSERPLTLFPESKTGDQRGESSDTYSWD